MTVVDDWQRTCSEFRIEEIWTGVFASGFGEVGDGRSFSFHTEQHRLVVDIYRPRLAGPVPHDEDVVARAAGTCSRSMSPTSAAWLPRSATWYPV